MRVSSEGERRLKAIILFMAFAYSTEAASIFFILRYFMHDIIRDAVVAIMLLIISAYFHLLIYLEAKFNELLQSKSST